MARLTVEIADTAESRARGLMYREGIPADSGMLFLFPTASPLSFWMKDTSVPLSIAFIDERWTIKEIFDMEPSSLASVCSSEPCMYAIEVNKGWFEANGVGVGDGVMWDTRITVDFIVEGKTAKLSSTHPDIDLKGRATWSSLPEGGTMTSWGGFLHRASGQYVNLKGEELEGGTHREMSSELGLGAMSYDATSGDWVRVRCYRQAKEVVIYPMGSGRYASTKDVEKIIWDLYQAGKVAEDFRVSIESSGDTQRKTVAEVMGMVMASSRTASEAFTQTFTAPDGVHDTLMDAILSIDGERTAQVGEKKRVGLDVDSTIFNDIEMVTDLTGIPHLKYDGDWVVAFGKPFNEIQAAVLSTELIPALENTKYALWQTIRDVEMLQAAGYEVEIITVRATCGMYGNRTDEVVAATDTYIAKVGLDGLRVTHTNDKAGYMHSRGGFIALIDDNPKHGTHAEASGFVWIKPQIDWTLPEIEREFARGREARVNV